ncbi:MAG: 50S ribosomal protein L10 [Candidatus Micrarchaeota archaeon]
MPVSRKEKQEAVQALKRKLGEYKVVAVASIQNLPSRHFNSVRKKIRGQAEMFMARETLMTRAIGEARPELKPLIEKFKGSCVLLLTNESAFKLAKLLRKSRSKTFAKAGQIAPSDIIVPAGETSLPPGPVLTELKNAKVQARIQGPKVVISADATVARKGEAITPAVAAVLSKLAIEPMEVGMKLTAAYEDGMLYSEEVLDIDDSWWLQQLALAHAQALNLAVEAEIFNAASTPLIIQKAARQANAIKSLVDSKAEKPAPEAPKAEQPVVEQKQEGAPQAQPEKNS